MLPTARSMFAKAPTLADTLSPRSVLHFAATEMMGQLRRNENYHTKAAESLLRVIVP